MRTTVTLDDHLIVSATDFSGIEEKSKLLNFVLTAYVKRMAARRLAALGGTMPDFEIAARNSRMSDDSTRPLPESNVAEER